MTGSWELKEGCVSESISPVQTHQREKFWPLLLPLVNYPQLYIHPPAPPPIFCPFKFNLSGQDSVCQMRDWLQTRQNTRQVPFQLLRASAELPFYDMVWVKPYLNKLPIVARGQILGIKELNMLRRFLSGQWSHFFCRHVPQLSLRVIEEHGWVTGTPYTHKK